MTKVTIEPGPNLPSTFDAQIAQPTTSTPPTVPPVALVEIETAAQLIPGPVGPQGPVGPIGPTGPQGSPDTAAQVLAKLVTVDGAGSGLDADLLDGQHGAYFLDWANFTSKPSTFPPTLPIAESDVTNLVSDLALKAPLASPSLTGTPTAPTAINGTNTTQIASTAFVQAAVTAAGAIVPSNANPVMDGVAAPGTSLLYSRGDHVHPTDTSRLAASAYTASDVLAKLVTVDGTGSGLDADLLDGHDTAFFATSASLSGYLPLTGGTLTGALTVQPASAVNATLSLKSSGTSVSALILDKASAGNQVFVDGRTGNLIRWRMAFGDGTAEGGSNAGSNFSLGRYDDAGTLIDAVLSIVRSTGLASVKGDPTANLGIATKQYVDAAHAGAFKRTLVAATSTSFQFDPTTLFADVEVIGCGGGGAAASGSAAAGTSRAGGGGGAGGYAKKLIQVTAGVRAATKTITIGAAGTAGSSGAAGGTGGTCSYTDTVNTLSCTGGAGGASGGAGSGMNYCAGGAGGQGTGGEINTQGQPGDPGISLGSSGNGTNNASANGGNGGSGPWGGGGVGVLVSSGSAGAFASGNAGSGYGSGGGGGYMVNASGSVGAGGAGYTGCVVITEYR